MANTTSSYAFGSHVILDDSPRSAVCLGGQLAWWWRIARGTHDVARETRADERDIETSEGEHASRENGHPVGKHISQHRERTGGIGRTRSSVRPRPRRRRRRTRRTPSRSPSPARCARSLPSCSFCGVIGVGDGHAGSGAPVEDGLWSRPEVAAAPSLDVGPPRLSKLSKLSTSPNGVDAYAARV